MSSGFSFLLFLVVIAQAINSSHSIKPDSDKWGIRSCVIQDEIKGDNYGCMPQEIDITDFEDLKGTKCTPEVDSVKLEQGPNSGVVTLTFFMETPNCRRYYNRSSGVVLQLEVKRPDSIDFVNYKIFSLITEKKFQSNRGVLSYTITVALPNDDAMFYASVYPIRHKKDGHSFVPPMLVGKPEKDNMFIDKIKIPEDEYVECKCDDIIVTINNTISLNLCDSSHFNSSTVTLQGAINICTPTIKNACEEKYSDLVDGVYSVLTYFKCKNNETKDCRKDITIITQKGDVNAIHAEDIFPNNVNKVLMIVGISTGVVMAIVVVLTYGLLKHHHHEVANKQKKREQRLKQRNDIMLVYASTSKQQRMIGEFAEALKKSTRLPVHFPDDEASQRERFANKFDWLDECLRNSKNFVFVASKDLFELLDKKCNGNPEVEFNKEQDWVSGIPCYVMDRVRGKRLSGLRGSRCFIVSFEDDDDDSNDGDDEKRNKTDYAHKLSQLSILQCKGTKLYRVSQNTPMTIKKQFLHELHGYKYPRLTNKNHPDTEEREILLQIEEREETAVKSIVRV